VTASLAGWLLAVLAAGGVGLTGRRLARIRRAVAHAEHELRGPLVAIRFAVDLGLREDGLGGRQLRAIVAEMGRVELALGDLARQRHGCDPVSSVAPAPRAMKIREKLATSPRSTCPGSSATRSRLGARPRSPAA